MNRFSVHRRTPSFKKKKLKFDTKMATSMNVEDAAPISGDGLSSTHCNCVSVHGE